MGRLWKRLAFLRRRKRFESEMEEELRFHLDMKTQDGVESGLSEEEARYGAQRHFGNTLKLRDESRDVWMLAAVETLAQDLRYGFRMLSKSLSFTAMSALGLGLGIGLSTTVFAIVNASLLRSLRQMKDPASCVYIAKSNYESFSYSDYTYLRDHNTALAVIGANGGRVKLIANLQPSSEPEEIGGRLITSDFFKVFGDEPSPGRAFLPEEDRTPVSHPVAILSQGFWQSRFASDPGVIGRSLRLNGDLFTVVGVAPPDTGDSVSVYLPLATQKTALPGADLLRDQNARWLNLKGRLRSGVSVEQAQSELTALLNGLREGRSEKDTHTTVVAAPGGMPPGKTREIVTSVLAVMLAVGMILLIACMNTANLLLARAAARRREIGVRLSLGASRGRLIRQLLTESILLALFAGTIGTLLTVWLTHAATVFMSPMSGFQASPDWRVFAYALLTSLGTGVAFGLAPALEASRPDLNFAMKAQGSPPRRQSLWAPRNALVVGPLAVSLMLLAGAGLILEFLHKNYVRNTSVDAENLLALALKLDLQGYDDNRASLFQKQLISRLEKIPGVRSVALTHDFPLANDDISAQPIRIEGVETPPNGRLPRVAYNIVSPNYFATIGIPVVRGRGFTSDDSKGAPGVAMINENLARKFWPAEDPIGKRFRLGNGTSSYQVIGIAKDIWDDGLALPQPGFVYVPNLQADPLHETARLKFLIRGEGGPGVPRKTILPALRGVVRSIDSKLWVLTGTLGDVAESALQAVRIGAVLSSGLGSLAMLLAALGIYGVMAYAVSQRTQEIGIRMALGAQKLDVLRLVLGRSVALIALGIALGLAGAFALSRVVSGFIAEVGGLDLTAFALVSTLLAVVAMLASYAPARRAAKVDPIVALRYE
jgi:macrolide transport system ATP-binding/permease protein